MPIEIIKQKLYLFIRDYSKNKKINLVNLRLWADHNKISRGDMGYALQLLKEQGIVYFSKKYGWLTR